MDEKKKFLVTLKYNSGEIKKFFILARSILSADKRMRLEFKKFLVNCNEMSVETIII